MAKKNVKCKKKTKESTNFIIKNKKPKTVIVSILRSHHPVIIYADIFYRRVRKESGEAGTK